MREKTVVIAGSGEMCSVLAGLLRARIPGVRLRFCADVRSLTDTSLRTCGEIPVLLLLPADEQELISLYLIHHRLPSASTILLLPDDDSLTMAIGRQCRTRHLLLPGQRTEDVLQALRHVLDGRRPKPCLQQPARFAA